MKTNLTYISAFMSLIVPIVVYAKTVEWLGLHHPTILILIGIAALGALSLWLALALMNNVLG